MNIDKSRQYDLEELDIARKNAPNPRFRDHYEKLMYKIIQEAGSLTSLREDLTEAIRADDKRAINRINQEIRHIRLNQTNGRSDH